MPDKLITSGDFRWFFRELQANELLILLNRENKKRGLRQTIV